MSRVARNLQLWADHCERHDHEFPEPHPRAYGVAIPYADALELGMEDGETIGHGRKLYVRDDVRRGIFRILCGAEHEGGPALNASVSLQVPEDETLVVAPPKEPAHVHA